MSALTDEDLTDIRRVMAALADAAHSKEYATAFLDLSVAPLLYLILAELRRLRRDLARLDARDTLG